MEMCIDNPRSGFADLFATHPSVDNRVQALVRIAGGRDPGPIALPSDTGDPGAAEPEAQRGPGDQAPPPLSKRPLERRQGPRPAASHAGTHAGCLDGRFPPVRGAKHQGTGRAPCRRGPIRPPETDLPRDYRDRGVRL